MRRNYFFVRWYSGDGVNKRRLSLFNEDEDYNHSSPSKLILATKIIKLSSVANMSLGAAQRHHEYADYTLF